MCAFIYTSKTLRLQRYNIPVWNPMIWLGKLRWPKTINKTGYGLFSPLLGLFTVVLNESFLLNTLTHRKV